MKILRKGMLFLLILFSLGFISASEPGDPFEYCKKDKYATKEPGTCLDPRAYRLLKAVENIEKNPYNNEFAKKVINFFEPSVKLTIDTTVRSGEFDVPIRIYYPTKQTLNTPTEVMFFIHGGAFMFGSIEEYDMAVKKLAKVMDRIIVAVDYRLAPEHPFPAALNDVDAVVRWIIANMESIGGKGKTITVIGDSAGANLATVLALLYRDTGLDLINAQILYYPPTTFMEKEFPSRIYFMRDSSRNYLLTEEFVRKSKTSYLPDSLPDDYPYVSPLEADLSGKLPRTLIITAQVDPLRDDGRLYAEKLVKAGQDVTYVEYEGLLHGFFNFYMLFRESKQSMLLVKEYLEDV